MRHPHPNLLKFVFSSFSSCSFLSPASRAVERVPDRPSCSLWMTPSNLQIQVLVAPLLEQMGFKATFFISHAWMDDKEHFLSWEDVADLHRRGFEIGNHTWTHAVFDKTGAGPKVERRVACRSTTPSPASEFQSRSALAGPGTTSDPKPSNSCGCTESSWPAAACSRKCRMAKYRLARCSTSHATRPFSFPLRVTRTLGWTFEHFKKVVAGTKDGKVVVLQFHGVPDTVHPWVNTPPEMFRQYMLYLKAERVST